MIKVISLGSGKRIFSHILAVVGMTFLMIHFPFPSSAKPIENVRTQRTDASSPILSKEDLVSSHSGTSSEFIPIEAQRAATEGNTAFSRGDFRQAVRAYQEVLQLLPNNLVGLVNFGVAQYRAGDISSAEKNLKRALSIRLETGVAWLTLGTAYMHQNRLDEALAALMQARLYEPRNAHVHNSLGVVMNRIGWSDAAESELRTAVGLDTAYSDAHYNLALVYVDRTPPAVELAKRHYYLAVQYGAPRDAQIETYFKKPTALSLENSP